MHCLFSTFIAASQVDENKDCASTKKLTNSEDCSESRNIIFVPASLSVIG